MTPRIASILEESVGNEVVFHAEGWVIMIGRWEDDEVPLIELFI